MFVRYYSRLVLRTEEVGSWEREVGVDRLKGRADLLIEIKNFVMNFQNWRKECQAHTYGCRCKCGLVVKGAKSRLIRWVVLKPKGISGLSLLFTYGIALL